MGEQLEQMLKINKDSMYCERILCFLIRGLSFTDYQAVFPENLSEKRVNGMILTIGKWIIEYLELKFEQVCTIIRKWKQETNQELVFSIDGRWSSRRHGKECTVSIIICQGPKELVGKILFHGNVLAKRRRAQLYTNLFLLSGEFVYSSTSMESFAVEKIFKILAQNKILPDGIVLDGDSSIFSKASKICEEEGVNLKRLLDSNHVKKNLKYQLIPKWIKK